MHNASRIAIRPAAVADCAGLSALSLRAKASHGYDAAFMAICVRELAVTPDLVASRVWRLAEDGARMFGCVSFDPRRAEIGAFLVDPATRGIGLGRILWLAIRDVALGMGAHLLALDSDPHAVGFYEKLGFAVTGSTPSASVPGRMLPRMEWRSPG